MPRSSKAEWNDLDALVQRAMHKEPQRRYQSVEALARDIDHYLKGEPLDAQSALERRRSVFGQDSKQVAESLFHLGALRGDQDCLPDAERLIRRALAIDQRHLPADHPSLAETKRALGQILERRGDYQGAIDVLQQAVRFHSRKGDSNVDYLASLNLLANAHFYLGHYAVSDSLNQKVLAIDKQMHGDRQPGPWLPVRTSARVLTQRGLVQEGWPCM